MFASERPARVQPGCCVHVELGPNAKQDALGCLLLARLALPLPASTHVAAGLPPALSRDIAGAVGTLVPGAIRRVSCGLVSATPAECSDFMSPRAELATVQS